MCIIYMDGFKYVLFKIQNFTQNRFEICLVSTYLGNDYELSEIFRSQSGGVIIIFLIEFMEVRF